MITLKKSFELQNYLKGLFDATLSVLAYQDNTTITKQEHMRKKVYSEGQDETVFKPKRNEYDFSINALIDFACYVQDEMAGLAFAINAAKHSGVNDFDGMIAVNNQKRKLLDRMISMSNIKPRESVVRGSAYKFNADGDQVTYIYDIKEVTTIDFDRNKTKGIASRLRRELDETSTTIDRMQLSIYVMHDTVFEIGDSLEEAVEKWMAATDTNDCNAEEFLI